MEYMFVLAMGIITGVLISSLVSIIWLSDGKMIIDQTNPDKDMYRLEIENLDILPKKKTIILKVEVKTENPLK